MPVCYCNDCKFVKEVSAQESQPTQCENCGGGAKLYHTTSFIQQLFGFVQKATAENQQLKNQLNYIQTEYDNLQLELTSKTTVQTQTKDNQVKATKEAIKPEPLKDINLLQTDSLATSEQHLPLKNYFERQQIKPIFDYQNVNTNGFFDETAQILGNNYAIFADLLSKITWAYNKKHNGLNYDLTKFSQNDIKSINNLCRQSYEHTLFARYSYNKTTKVVNLALQQATPIKQFFLGEWLEWYVLSQILSYIEKLPNKPKFACARGMKVQFSNQDIHELDFAFLNSKAELFVIECKSGEYRQDIQKYLTLRKRLNIPSNRFTLLVTDLSQTQVQSMSAMYDINFVGIRELKDYIQSMVQ